jgi:hypothetical protein
MTREVFYRKVGRKYVPISEYDSHFMDSIRTGTHLVSCIPGGRTTRYNIDPDYAAMIAAGQYAEDAISKAIMRAQEMRPHQNEALTNEQHDAWEKFVEVMGERGRYIEVPSAREAAEAGILAMMKAATELFESNPSVKQAYEDLLTLASLSKKP